MFQFCLHYGCLVVDGWRFVGDMVCMCVCDMFRVGGVCLYAALSAGPEAVGGEA